MATIAECLASFDVTAESFTAAHSIDQEWRIVKCVLRPCVREDARPVTHPWPVRKSYFIKIRLVHPDKGGDIDVFRDVQESFETLRNLFSKGKVSSFAEQMMKKTDKPTKAEKASGKKSGKYQTGPPPAYQFYADAAEEESPLYRVERAKSSRYGKVLFVCVALAHRSLPPAVFLSPSVCVFAR